MIWITRMAWVDLAVCLIAVWAIHALRAPAPLYLIPAELATASAIRLGLVKVGEVRGWH